LAVHTQAKRMCVLRQLCEYLEEKEMQAVFDAVDINSRTGIRDRALLLFLYNTDARL